mmetsp:Transcript_30201/g.56048  ORF Transcript_30201/g.56048 Transcript_30201/m.56048 type:complete len:211 (-) Transcript_30201:4432-5064(-)
MIEIALFAIQLLLLMLIRFLPLMLIQFLLMTAIQLLLLTSIQFVLQTLIQFVILTLIRFVIQMKTQPQTRISRLKNSSNAFATNFKRHGIAFLTHIKLLRLRKCCHHFVIPMHLPAHFLERQPDAGSHYLNLPRLLYSVPSIFVSHHLSLWPRSRLLWRRCVGISVTVQSMFITLISTKNRIKCSTFLTASRNVVVIEISPSFYLRLPRC